MSLHGYELLLIDDDVDFVNLTRMILEGDGARVTTAPSIKLALGELQKKLPHLILLDLNLPDVTGLNFMEIRKKLDALKSIPIMVISAKNDKETVIKTLELGAREFLTKPITRFTLINKVERVLKTYKEQPLQFTFEKPLEATITLPTTLIKMGEREAMVECAAKLTGDTPIELRSRTLAANGIETAICKVNSRPSHLIVDNLFTSTLNFFGVSPATSKKILELIESWK